MKQTLFKSLLRVCLIASLVFSFVTIQGTQFVAAADPEWLGNWAYRETIYIDSSKIGETLLNFPVLINISASAGLSRTDLTDVFTKLVSDSNREKIAVTTSDGVTQCNVEIVNWNTSSRQSFLWVRVPTVTTGVDTVLYLYYDAAQPDNTAFVGDTGSTVAEAIWDSNYVSVYHMAQSGVGLVGEYKDSTANGHEGQGGAGSGLREYFNSGDTNYTSVGGTQSAYQILTPVTSFSISSLNLKLFKAGSPAGARVGIYASSGGLPSGSELTGININIASLSTSNSGAWYSFNLSSAYPLVGGKQYALVVSAISGTIGWRYKSNGSYAGGSGGYGSMGSWTAQSGSDYMFETYGTGGASDVPTLSSTAIGYPCQYFNGQQYIQIPDSDAFSISTNYGLTVSADVSPSDVNMAATEGVGDFVRLLGKGENSSQDEWHFVYYNQSYSPRSQWISWYNYSLSGGQGAGDYSVGAIVQNGWVRILGRSWGTSQTSGNESIYRNDLQYTGASDDWQSYGLTVANGTAPVRIGEMYPGGGNWIGKISEIRISKIARSNNWENASYFAENDQLLSYYPIAQNIISSQKAAYSTGDNTGISSHDKTQVCQTFTTSEAFTITSVHIKLSSAAKVTSGIIRVKAVDGNGKPSGADLCSGAIIVSSVTTSPGNWITVGLGNGVPLATSRQYAIILDCSDTLTPLFWRTNSSNPAFPGGQSGESTDGGNNWSMEPYDCMFQIWGGQSGGSGALSYDFNSDGHINTLEMILIGQLFNSTGTPGWIPEDVNKDGVINVLDMNLVGQHWTG